MADQSSEMLVEPLDDSSDERGHSVSVIARQLSLIGDVRDIHIGEIRPGHVRGNHYHAQRGELIAVVYSDSWSLHWDTGHGTTVHRRTFTGSGGVIVRPPRQWSHAVRNDGATSLWIVATSDAAYDRHTHLEQERDAVRRVVV